MAPKASTTTSSETEHDLHQERQVVQKELSELIVQLQHWYLEWIKPNAAEARMMTTGGKRLGQEKVLSLAEADALDLTTPTAKFEKGRAYWAVLDARMVKLKKREQALVERLEGIAKAQGMREGLGRAPTQLAYRFRQSVKRRMFH